MKTVAVLCAARNSIYHEIPECDVYDADRDARTFDGSLPVIAHPPCRAWSAYCAHQAKPEPGEKELGLWCCQMVIRCGGILEQPAHSRLFAAGGLQHPGKGIADLWTANVWQSWWGHPVSKNTWLCFSKIPQNTVEFPFRLHDQRGDRRKWQVMSQNQRSQTCESLARWMVKYAKEARNAKRTADS